jgi:RND family efflux transporter MFP subunit
MSMPKRLVMIGAPFALIGLAIFVVVVLAMNRPQPPEREVAPSAMVVDVIEAQASQGFFEIQAQGTVRPRTRTSLAAEVSGRIVEVADNLVAGGFFRAGDVLAEIDPSDYEAALLQAEADLASARARLADEKARSDQAARDWQRMHGEAREPGELVLRLPQVAGAEAAVQAAEAAVMRARRNLERTRIRLPYDGLIERREVDLGQYVSPGTVLAVAFAVDRAEIRLPLPDQDLAFIDLPAPGTDRPSPSPVTLVGSVAGRLGQWHGQVVRTEGVVDEGTRMTYLVVEVQDPYGLLDERRSVPLTIGTFVQARIRGRDASGLMDLPRAALREDDTIYLANSEDQLEIRPVTVIRSTAQRVYVSNDLEPGDRIITTALQAPVPGMRLRVRESAAPDPQLRLLPAGELVAHPDRS